MKVIGIKVVENKPYSLDNNGTHYEGLSSKLYLYLKQDLKADEKNFITSAEGYKTFEVAFKLPVDFKYDDLIDCDVDVLYNSYRQPQSIIVK